ncbi:hypothetical protein J3366_17780 [Tritonibacter mobilis]|uniref:hypothetical protein n=1 Tax=Tritonibacter mobilis TaxID=379347 RepID=UPI003BAB99A5
MLVWFLWPGATWQFEPEAFFAFGVAVVFWAFTEFKLSEEVIYRASTPNDIRFGREIFAYGMWSFRELLKDHDYHRGIHPRFLTEASCLVSETELGITHFQDKKVQKKYLDFFGRLTSFVDYFSMHSSPERFGAITLQSVIPANQFDEMNIADHHQAEINEVNRLANEAWQAMLPLIAEIKVRIPEVFDEPIKSDWIRSPEE